MHPVNPLSDNAPYFIILLCLMPDDFTHQGESAATQWVVILLILLSFQNCEMNHSVIHAVEKLSLDVTYNPSNGRMQPHSLTNVTLTKEDENETDGSPQSGIHYCTMVNCCSTPSL